MRALEAAGGILNRGILEDITSILTMSAFLSLVRIMEQAGMIM